MYIQREENLLSHVLYGVIHNSSETEGTQVSVSGMDKDEHIYRREWDLFLKGMKLSFMTVG